MIVRKVVRLVFLAVFLLLTGCSQSLNMELAIYKDDPLFKNVITKDGLKPTRHYLNQVEDELDSIVQMKIDVADKLGDTFKTYWILNIKVNNKSRDKNITDLNARKQAEKELNPLNKQKDDYVLSLYTKATEVRQSIAQANVTYKVLEGLLPENLEDINFTSSSFVGQMRRQQSLKLALSIEVSKIHQKLNSILNDTDNNYYRSTKANLTAISDLLSSRNFNKHLNNEERSKLSTGLIETVKKVKEVTSTLVSLRSGLEAVINSNKPEVLVQSLMKNPTVYKLSAKEESEMLQAVDLLNSQLDRLQITSSPVWRIVTDPKNKDKWNTEFSKTCFYAQGDAGVVVVRDSPIKYRVQEARNNPAALVEAQLHISRSVADAAIQIAGATTGIPALTVTQSSDKSIQKNENQNYQQETENLVTKRAQLKAKEVIYQKTINAMEANIDSYMRQVNELKAIQPQDQNVTVREDFQAKTNTLNKKIINYLIAQKSLLSTDN